MQTIENTNEADYAPSRAGEAGANLTDVLGAERYQKLRRWHQRLEVRYWTGQWWEPLTGEALDVALDNLPPAPEFDVSLAPNAALRGDSDLIAGVPLESTVMQRKD